MSMAMTTPGTADAALAALKGRVIEALASGSSKSLNLGSSGQSDIATTAGSLLSSITAAMMQQPALLASMQPSINKAFSTASLDNPMQVTDKSFWSSVLHVVQQAAPIALSVISSVAGGSKDFNSVAQSPEAQRHADDKDWQNFVADLLTQVSPLVVHALRGTKDFSQPGAVTLNLQVPANIKGDTKGWFDDAMKFVGHALPTVLPLVLSAI
jgi:hypothetical protein